MEVLGENSRDQRMMSGMSGAAPAHPADIELRKSSDLRIRWTDGHESVIPLVELRRNCPCATCRAAREERERNPLAILSVRSSESDFATAASAELVGHYALRIRWNDGHDTGIYDFGLLRRLG